MHDDADDVEDTVIRPRSRQSGSARAQDAVDDTVLRDPSAALPHHPVGPDSGPRVSDELDDDPLGDTVIRGPRGGPDASTAPEDTVLRAPRTAPLTRPTAFPADAPTSLPPVQEAPRARVPSIRVGGRVIRLDRPVVIGRRPALPRIVRGPVPELVTVVSPLGQVSSSHLLVHAEGEAAVVDDLRSTNGTVVRPAGSAPYRMSSGASIVALTGTVVEIGDGIAVEILSPHLRVTPGVDGFPPSLHQPPIHPTGTPRTPRERS